MNSTFLALLPLVVVLGVAAGFAVPLAASYQTKSVFDAHFAPGQEIIAPAALAPDLAHDSEMANLVARNRRLEALVANLRRKNAELADRSSQY